MDAVAQSHATVKLALQMLISMLTVYASVTTYTADIAVPSTKDSVTNVASAASDLPTRTVKAAYAMHTETNTDHVSATLTGVTKTAVSMPDNAIQNVRTAASDLMTPTVSNVYAMQLAKRPPTVVYVTSGGLAQTVATTWDHVIQLVTDVVDHSRTAPSQRISDFVMNVLITHIVIATEIVCVTTNGIRKMIVPSTAAHAGRTALKKTEIAPHVDVTAQPNTTASIALHTPTDLWMDTVLVTQTGEIQTPLTEKHAATTPENATIVARTAVLDPPTTIA